MDRANLDLPLKQEDKPAGEVLGQVATTTGSPRVRAPPDEHCRSQGVRSEWSGEAVCGSRVSAWQDIGN